MKMLKIEDPDTLPTGKHYVVLIYSERNISHEGDERSRTNPGHGYPAYTETFTQIEHYSTINIDVWKNDIIELNERLRRVTYNHKMKFVAFEVNKLAQIKTTVEVE